MTVQEAIQRLQQASASERIQIIELLLQSLKNDLSQPQRGSAVAILDTLEEVGPLQFEEGELDTLLAEIESMRLLDLQENG